MKAIERRLLCGLGHSTVFYSNDGQLGQLEIDDAGEAHLAAEETEIDCGPSELESADELRNPP